MAITLFSDLITTPGTKKVVIAEIQPREDVASNTWTKGTNDYRITYLQESITLHNGATHIINKAVTSVSKVVEGTAAVALTEQASQANVSANANSYWHDTANQLLYVRLTGTSDDPETSVDALMVTFTLYFATESVTLNDKFYEPRIESAPSISQETESILSGFSIIGAGDLVMNNNDGFFNVIIDKFVWENRIITIKFGGEDLVYSEYATVFTGQIYNKFWNEEEVSFNVRDNQTSLLRSIPETIYNDTDNPNADPNIIGLPVPIAYGTFVERTAPTLFVQDESNKADGDGNLVIFTIADHTVNSADNAWVSPDNGDTWFQLTAQSPNTDAPDTAGKWGGYDDTGTIGDASDNSKITVKFAVDSGAGTSASTTPYVTDQTRVKFAFKGRENSNTTQMTSLSDTVADLIDTFNDFTSANRNTTSFSDSKTFSDNTMFLYINEVTRTSDIIDKICRSEPAQFFSDAIGKFNYVALNPIVGELLSGTTSTPDTANKLIDSTAKFITKKVRIGDEVDNTDTSTYTTVTAIDSETQLSLSDDIFTSFPEAYTLHINPIAMDRNDLLSFNASFDQLEHFTKIKVGYQQSTLTDKYLYNLSEDTVARDRDGNKNQKLIETFLDTVSDADILGGRQLYIRKFPTTRVKGTVKWQLAEKNIGDKISLTSSRAPFSDSAGYLNRHFQLVTLVKDLNSMQMYFEAIDLKNLGEDVGHWVDDTAVVWGTASDSQKVSWGWWLNDNGFADASDSDSRFVSRWF